jgi:hypothetical protein
MPRLRFLLFFFAVLTTSLSLPAQQPAPAPKPQTARQALIEMTTKGFDGLHKHLTVEVQELLKSGGKSQALGSIGFSGLTLPGGGWQAYEVGEVLLTYEESAKHTKYEIHIDNDDLAGGQEESFQLSIHEFQDGKEVREDLGLLSPSFTVSLRLQQNIWRLEKIVASAEIPIGDPKFVQEVFLKPATRETRAVAEKSGLDVIEKPDARPADTPADQVVQLLASADMIFARMHPEIGFTCSLSDLSETTKMLQIDPQVNSGIYNGYRFGLSGCEGKPAGSFRIVAEPAVFAPQAKAYCTDATQNVRASEDGRGITCLSAGKPLNPGAEGFAGVHLSKPIDDSKK